MSKKLQLLSCLKKRHLLNAQLFDQDECVRYGKLYEASGYISDAVDFYAKAKAWDELKALLPRVIEEGDVFLFEKIYHSLKETPSEEEWKKIGDVALKLDKWVFAYKAYLKAGVTEKVEEVEKLLKEKGLFVLPQTSLPGTGQEPVKKILVKKKRKKRRKK